MVTKGIFARMRDGSIIKEKDLEEKIEETSRLWYINAGEMYQRFRDERY